MDKIIIRAENSRTLINLDEPVLTLSNQRIVMDTIDRSPELVGYLQLTLIYSFKNVSRHQHQSKQRVAEHRNQLLKTAKKKKRRDSFGPLKRMRKTLSKNDEQKESEQDVQVPQRAPEPVTARAEPGKGYFTNRF